MTAPHTLSDINKVLDRLPRIPFVHGPTPFYKLTALSEWLGGPPIYVKRDDLTGMALGGNKSRKLEYILADARAAGADTILTWGGRQSNWCLQTAASSRMIGLDPVLVLFGLGDIERDGNLLLDTVLQADIRFVEGVKGKVIKPAEALEILNPIAEELHARGRKPYAVPVGGSWPAGDMKNPLGAVAYVAAFAEMLEQADAAGIEVGHVVHATGSGGTQAGLVVGAKALAPECRVTGVSVSDPAASFSREVMTIAVQTDQFLGLGLNVSAADIIVDDAHIGEGYGILNKATSEALRAVFIREGLVLDPVYTAKAMAGLIDFVRAGTFRPDKAVVFFHTGGTPALFPYRSELLKFLS
jgi:D-cysteine desulfhydrase family pyridoxal phosphate-dependent enzyme